MKTDALLDTIAAMRRAAAERAAAEAMAEIHRGMIPHRIAAMMPCQDSRVRVTGCIFDGSWDYTRQGRIELTLFIDGMERAQHTLDAYPDSAPPIILRAADQAAAWVRETVDFLASPDREGDAGLDGGEP